MSCRILIYVNIAVYVLLKILWLLLPEVPTDFEALLPWIALSADVSEALSHPWTFISYAFVQVDFLHLLVNILWLWWFGSILESLRGIRSLSLVYITGALAGAAGFLAQSVICRTPASVCLTGASAATAAIVAAVAITSPRYMVRLFIIGRVPVVLLAAIALICFFTGSTASIAAHAGGIVAGGIVSYLWLRQRRAGTQRMRRHLQRVSKKQKILEKARTSGYGSLTNDERLTLFNLSDNNL